MRAVLYMATLSARRCNGVIRAFAQRLEHAGKPFEVVMVACMRKLLTILHSMIRERKTWNPEIAPANP